MEALQEFWFVAIPVAILVWMMFRRGGTGNSFPYQRKLTLMTPNEQRFYAVLLRAVGDKYDVFGMVRIADLLEVIPGTAKPQVWRSRINGKHIDFVLCDREQHPCLAIELDDRSHLRKDRQERDYFVDRAFDAAGLPLLRVEASRSYSASELRDAIATELARKPDRLLPSERRIRIG